MIQNNGVKKKEKTLPEIIHIIYSRKIFIIISVCLLLALAVLYNQITTPVYESKALLKKEMADQEQSSNELYDIVKLQTQDEVETELELVKTREVLSGVIKDLNLFFDLKAIEEPNGYKHSMKNVFVSFPDSGNSYSSQIDFDLPLFSNIELKEKKSKFELYIVKKGKDIFELHDMKTDKLISRNQKAVLTDDDLARSEIDSMIVQGSKPSKVRFNADFVDFDLSWEDASVGCKVYFNIGNHDNLLSRLAKQINVSKIGKTNVFQLSIRSSSPFAAKIIAESVIDNFRSTRIEQQKQSIRYSFRFVDEQLTEIQNNLLVAENNLSNFKAGGQIVTIEESSQELLNYLSTLEAEKLQTDILLSDYKSKVEQMKNQLQASGFFDQSYLEPQGENESSNSPFSNLMQQLSSYELQRLELIQRRTDNHPEVKRLDDQIRLAKERLAGYNQNTLTAYRIIINTLEQKLLKINNLMSTYEVRMQRLPKQESKLARLIRQKDVYEKIFTLLLDKREEMRMAELSKLQDIIIVDPPMESGEPILPRKRLNMLIALILGGFLGIVAIFFVELKSSKMINVDDLEEEFQSPVLAIIPSYAKDIMKRMKSPKDYKDHFVTLMDDQQGIRESYRLLKTKLFHQLNGRQKIFLVTSCEEDAGKSNVVANLAITIAKENQRVLIIDGDLRKAGLSRMFGISSRSPGLLDFITKGIEPKIYTKVIKMIDIIPTGGIREDSGAVLNSDRMKLLFKTIDTSSYEYIIIDTPPVTRVVDTLILGQIVRDGILVVRPGMSYKEAVLWGLQELNQAKIKVRGIVANAADIKKSYYYRYRYGYGYGYSHRETISSGNGRDRIKSLREKVS